jgi:outer membrane biosynthesis protein TonB
MPRRPIGDQPGAGSGGGAPGIGVGQGIGPGRVGNAGGGERAGTPEAARPPGAPCGGDERTFRPGEVTRRARLLTRPEPVYTVWARRFYVTGAVRARAILKADGTVGGVAAITRLPHGLTRKALEAMSAIKFEPAEKDGCKVSQYVTIDYNFNIY